MDNVTAADIADRAGVTERTFFRHFRTKEDAALLIHQHFDRALREGLPAPAHAPAHEVVAALYRRALQDYDRRDKDLAGEMLRVQKLVARSPQLRLASLRRDDERSEELVAHLLACAESRSADDELEVRTAVEVTGAAVRVAFTTWSSRGDDVSLADLFDKCLRSLRDWGRVP